MLADDVDRLILSICELHDGPELWAHAKRDPDAFRLAVSHALGLVRPNKIDRERIDRGDYVRAAGDACDRVCGQPLRDHPGVAGYGWLVRACDGRLFKL